MGAGWPSFFFIGFGLAIGVAFTVEAVRQQTDLVLVMPNGIFHRGWKGMKRHYWGACWGDIVEFEIGINNNSEGSPSRMYFQVHDNIEIQYCAIIARHQTRFDPEESWTWYIRLHLKQEMQESGEGPFIQGGLIPHEINVTNRISQMLPEPPINLRVAMVIYTYWKLSTGK